MDYNDELKGIKAILEKMAEKQNEMDGIVRTMDKTLTQLNQTVIGNPIYGQKGLVAEIDDIKKYVDNDKLLKNKLSGGLVIVGIVWTVILQYAGYLFSVKK
jgi:hypothetical protein